jgi:hypothetical protein
MINSFGDEEVVAARCCILAALVRFRCRSAFAFQATIHRFLGSRHGCEAVQGPYQQDYR